ncbi:MAG: hypothetical protein ACFE0Q_16010 [Anaerolineae bacterium]
MNHITVTDPEHAIGDMHQLEDMLEFIDMLHTVVSEGDLPNFAEMDEAQMMNLLREIVYTAQQTIIELEATRASKRARPVLHIVPKVEKAG